MIFATSRQLTFIQDLMEEGYRSLVEERLRELGKDSLQDISRDEAHRIISGILNGDFSSTDALEWIDSEYAGKRVWIEDAYCIPGPLRRAEFRFCLVKPKGKEPIEKGWQKAANYSWNDPVLQKHIDDGGNYGVIGGYGGLAVIDVDNDSYINTVIDALPSTFTVKTKKGVHLYFTISEGDVPSKVLKTFETGENVGDVKAGSTEKSRSRGYVVGPGSIHPDGPKYKVMRNREIASVTATELEKSLLEIDISIGAQYITKKQRAMRVKETDKESYYVIKNKDYEDPEYIQYLPLWYRTHHRKRNGDILRKHDGMIVHLRICATLKKHFGDHWKEYAHDLTKWMFQDDYDYEKTEYQLGRIQEKFYFRSKDYFFYGDLHPDLEYLNERERAGITEMYVKNAGF